MSAQGLYPKAGNLSETTPSGKRDLPTAQSPVDFLVGLIGGRSPNGPDGGGNPADQRDLQDQADKPRNRASDGEKNQKWKKKSYKKAKHNAPLSSSVEKPKT